MILKIISLLRDMVLYIIDGIIKVSIEIFNTFIQCIVIIKEEATISSPLELVLVFVFFIGLGWFFFKFLIGSIETYVKFIVLLSILAVLTLIIIIYF